MTPLDTKACFTAKILQPAKPDDDTPWAFLILPKEESEKLPRRGRTSVEGSINGHRFQATLDPDGQLSHWLKVDEDLLATADIKIGEIVSIEMTPVAQEPEPSIPSDFQKALESSPEAFAVWRQTTTIARLDWIHWMTSAKQAKTRVKRVNDACEMLAAGKKRVCCFDPSGYYSKALRAPAAAK